MYKNNAHTICFLKDYDPEIAALMNEYVVSQEQAASDVDAFLQILQSRGFLA